MNDRRFDLRLEIGIDARRFIQHVSSDNQMLENQIAEGIQLAIDDISNEENFVQMVREETKANISKTIKQCMTSYQVESMLTNMIREKVGLKLEQYADKIVSSMTKNLDQEIL